MKQANTSITVTAAVRGAANYNDAEAQFTISAHQAGSMGIAVSPAAVQPYTGAEQVLVSVTNPLGASITYTVEDSQGTMFVFAKLPSRWENNSAGFCEALVDACGVVCTPGAAFGSLGEGYVRFALVCPPEELAAIARRIGECGILK